MSHDYRIKYTVDHEIGRFPKEEVKSSGKGGTDCLLIGSMLHPADGSYSQTYFTVDGRNEGKDLSADDEFKFWILMAATLSQKVSLSPGKKAFVSSVFETYREAFLTSKCEHKEEAAKTTQEIIEKARNNGSDHS